MQRESESGRIVISFKVKPSLKEGLQARARQDRRTLSAYIEMVLEDHLAGQTNTAKKDKTGG